MVESLMNMAIIVSLLLCGVLAIISVLSTIASLLVWRGCMKMYTEYFKDRSMGKRVGNDTK